MTEEQAAQLIREIVRLADAVEKLVELRTPAPRPSATASPSPRPVAAPARSTTSSA